MSSGGSQRAAATSTRSLAVGGSPIAAERRPRVRGQRWSPIAAVAAVTAPSSPSRLAAGDVAQEVGLLAEAARRRPRRPRRGPARWVRSPIAAAAVVPGGGNVDQLGGGGAAVVADRGNVDQLGGGGAAVVADRGGGDLAELAALDVGHVPQEHAGDQREALDRGSGSPSWRRRTGPTSATGSATSSARSSTQTVYLPHAVLDAVHWSTSLRAKHATKYDPVADDLADVAQQGRWPAVREARSPDCPRPGSAGGLLADRVGGHLDQLTSTTSGG